MLRSLLFVPGDSERKQTKALSSEADALVLDLEDSVAPPALPEARERVARLLAARRDRAGPALWVRVNAPASGLLAGDLEAVLAGAPAGIVLPKVRGPEDCVGVARRLDELEAQAGVARGSTRLLPIVTETPRALVGDHDYARVGARLAALTWGAEDLAAAVGARSNRDEDGALTFTYRMARSLCLLSAAAAGVPAIDCAWLAFRDAAGLEREAAEACRDGFAGKLAIHPDQLEPIHRAFTPTPPEVEEARRVVAAFDRAPEAGVVSLDGRMLDRPHLIQAQRILALANATRRAGDR